MTLPTVEGQGLITGLPCAVTLQKYDHPGITFAWSNGDSIQPSLSAIHATERGVTLIGPQGQTLSIVEHFLAACALCNASHVRVTVDGPELPILDGSAAEWLALLAPFAQATEPTPKPLPTPVRVQHGDSWLTAEPADRFSLTYTVDFPHPALQQKTVTWSPTEPDALRIAHAGTFGLVSELPAMQAKGFALGVTAHNTLGLTDESQFTRPLRLPDEPVYHKMLDCLGDLMLTGTNPLTVGMHVTAYKAGHTSHLLLAKQLLNLNTPA